MKKKGYQKAVGISLAILVVALTAFFIILKIMGEKHYVFYYPDDEWKGLKSENRIIKIQKAQIGFPEQLMVQDYLLGPVHYRYRLDMPDTMSLLNVWPVSNQMLILDFNDEFEKFAKNNAAECGWFIQGLSETVKKNTRFKKILFLVNSERIYAVVNEKNLAYPISVLREKKVNKIP